jgi:preprotein translocase subunit Sec61beta
MQLNKKKYFDKIINWFSLFDNYAKKLMQIKPKVILKMSLMFIFIIYNLIKVI